MSGTTTWYDYRLMFPIAGIALALQFLDAVRAAGFMGGAGNLSDNMLGDARTATGAVCAFANETGEPVGRVFNGRPGMAAFSYTDPVTELVVDVPAVGDPAMMYLHVRSPVAPAQSAALQASLGLSPAAYGIAPSDPVVSAAVLGAWA